MNHLVNSNANLNFRKLFNVCYAQIIVLCMNIYLVNCKKTFDQLFHLHTNMCVWRERRKAKQIMHVCYYYAIYNNVYTILYVILFHLIAEYIFHRVGRSFIYLVILRLSREPETKLPIPAES